MWSVDKSFINNLKAACRLAMQNSDTTKRLGFIAVETKRHDKSIVATSRLKPAIQNPLVVKSPEPVRKRCEVIQARVSRDSKDLAASPSDQGANQPAPLLNAQDAPRSPQTPGSRDTPMEPPRTKAWVSFLSFSSDCTLTRRSPRVPYPNVQTTKAS
jgi:hypothetical protein